LAKKIKKFSGIQFDPKAVVNWDIAVVQSGDKASFLK